MPSVKVSKKSGASKVSKKSRAPAGLIEPKDNDFTVESARFILSLTFSQQTQDRAQELMDKNNEGQISPSEKRELSQLVQADTYLATLQSKARLFMKEGGTRVPRRG
jgi:hypothetical protein